MIHQHISLLLFFLLLPAAIRGQTCKSCSAGQITIDDNGAYNDILVVIGDNVPYDQNIIPNIKEYIQSASDALYAATAPVSGRYFGEVTILQPQHWPEDNTTSATTESAQKATFLVESDSPAWGSNPHTIRLQGACGSLGKVIVLPESFTKDKNEALKYGSNIGKTIVHEWAHYRYGVFDESALEDGGDPISCDAIEDTRAVSRCSEQIEGTVMSGEESGTCIFTPNAQQTSGASLLYAPYIDSVYTFCDDESDDTGLRHNPYPSNEQNSRCNLRSVWSVMKSHKDFAPGVIGASGTRPVRFRVVHDNMLRISIVMDVSGSMNDYDRLTWMQQSVESFLKSLLFATRINEEEVMVGMTKFESVATKLHNLVLLDDTTINSLIAAIPKVANGGTSIGAGILTGLDVLGEKGVRNFLMVFTDGQENTSPMINDVKDEVCEYNATVYGMLVSNVASNHPLITLSQETCGASCVYDDTSAITMYDCLWTALKSRIPKIAPVEISAQVVPVERFSSWADDISIDSAFTSSVVFRYEWSAASASSGCRQIKVNILTPDNKLIDESMTTNYTSTNTLVEIHAASKTVGKWQHTIENPSSTLCDVRITIEGYSSDVEEAATIEVQLSRENLELDKTNTVEENSVAVYVKVIKGTTPIIGAQVTAIIVRNQQEWRLTLLDNGASADLRANDGVYSRYFTEFDSDGTYSVRIEVIGENGQVQLYQETRSYGSGSPPLPEYRVTKTSSIESTEPFERSSVGGYIEISGYSSIGSTEALYPPEKITDLTATVADYDKRELRVQWTAVGAYLDNGIATSYNMRISDDPLQLQYNFSQTTQVTGGMIVSGSLNSPQQAGQLEQITLSLANTKFSKQSHQYYLAIVAVNSYNNVGQVSNIEAYAFYYYPPVAFPGWATALIVVVCVASLASVGIVAYSVYKKKSSVYPETARVKA